MERHHAEGLSFINAGWLRQMSGGLKLRKGWRATNSSDHFRGLDVTASMSVFQTERAGAAPAGRTLFISFPSWCNSSIPPSDGDGAGADPAEGTPSF